MPCLSLRLERDKDLKGSMASRRSVSLLDASSVK